MAARVTAVADSAAALIFKGAKKIGGARGEAVANAVTGPLLGRVHERCSDACGHCNVPCVNGTCQHA